MTNAVDICNLALNRIGKKAAVSNISPPDGSDEALSCSRMYPLALGTILDAHNWSFATKRKTLAKLADVDAAPWAYAYALPNGCRRVIDIQETPDENENPAELGYGFGTYYRWRTVEHFLTDGQPVEFEIVNGGSTLALLTDIERPTCRYIVSDPPVSFFSAAFTDALAWLLASYLAGLTIRGETSFNFCAMCQRQYEATVAKAAAQDARQVKVRPKVLPFSVRGRYGFY